MAIRIPFFDSKVDMIPEAAGARMSQPAAMPMESVEAAGIPGMRLAKAGDQLSAVATEVTERLTHARNIKDFAEMDLQTRLRLDNLSNEIQQDPEAPPETWSKRFEEGAAKIKAEVRGLTGNELVQSNYDKKWASYYPTRLQEITAKGNKQDAKISGAAFEEHLPQYTTLYAQATDDLSRAQINETVDSYIIAAVKTGSISPQRGAKARLEFIPEAMKVRVLQDAQGDPAGVLERLKEPEKYYPGLTPDTITSLTEKINGQVHRVQNDNYSRYMQNIFGATADNPVQGAVMPTEEEILPQVGKTLGVPQAENILAYIRGQKASQGTGRDYKTDPQSYKEAATRLTDPDNPLTREEFLKNVEAGEWKFDAKTYGSFLNNINSRGSRLDKAADSAIKSRIGFWKTQYGLDPKGDQIMTALGQVQAAKDAGELGKTPDEINKAVDSIFKPQHDLYMQEWGLGTRKPAEKKPGIISRIGGLFGGQGGAAGPETISKNGKTYRIVIIKGKKMVDPNPLP